jgi:hypothetical protein
VENETRKRVCIQNAAQRLNVLLRWRVQQATHTSFTEKGECMAVLVEVPLAHLVETQSLSVRRVACCDLLPVNLSDVEETLKEFAAMAVFPLTQTDLVILQ